MQEQTTSQQNPQSPGSLPGENLDRAYGYLQQVLSLRLKAYVKGNDEFQFPEPPSWVEEESAFYEFLQGRNPDVYELLTLLLALAPQLHPGIFDAAVAEHMPRGGDLPEFGGVKGNQHRGMLPTGDTVLFVLAGNDSLLRRQLQAWFRHHPFFQQERYVILDPPKPGDPPMSGRVWVDPELAEWLLTGQISVPKMSASFPAQYLQSGLDWEDLVLDPDTEARIRDLEAWLSHQQVLMQEWGMNRKLKPGYRVLFHGPPGTGKTLTATLLGKNTGLPVFRIDLSMVVSKYIGETEKNLSSLFDKAENKNWILFFDEADSLFGKRTNVRDAHDKYANQEVSYLLQRIETYPGLVILASNFKSNIDEAFLRRFQSVVYFPLPKPEERYRLWQKAFPEQIQLEEGLDLKAISHQYELSGSNIMNIVQHACIRTLSKGTSLLDTETLTYSIRHEYSKVDKVMDDRLFRKKRR